MKMKILHDTDIMTSDTKIQISPKKKKKTTSKNSSPGRYSTLIFLVFFKIMREFN